MTTDINSVVRRLLTRVNATGVPPIQRLTALHFCEMLQQHGYREDDCADFEIDGRQWYGLSSSGPPGSSLGIALLNNPTGPKLQIRCVVPIGPKSGLWEVWIAVNGSPRAARNEQPYQFAHKEGQRELLRALLTQMRPGPTN